MPPRRVVKTAAPVKSTDTWVSGDKSMKTVSAPQEEKIEEMDTDTPVEDSSVAGKKYPAWLKLGADGKPIKRKPNLAKRNALFRKHLQPKNAVMCLNQLVKGLEYTVEPEAAIGSFSATVEVNGTTYRGYGSSKTLAKQAAAEAALVSFVKPPPAEGEEDAVDETPWKTVASFALYRLFKHWSEGTTTSAPQPPVPTPSVRAVPDLRNYLSEVQYQKAVANPPVNAVNMGAKKERKLTRGPAKHIKEENKINSHPVMILSQLLPSLQYDSEMKTLPDHTKHFTISAEVGGNVYTCEGPNTKKTKFDLAKIILKEAYGIENVFVAAK